MVNEQIMIDTVKRMIDAGIDDATIISTLTDAGLSNEQCLAIISKVKEPVPKEETFASVQPAQDVSALRNVIEATADAQDLHAATTSTALEDHEQKIAQVNEKINSMSQAISSTQNKPDATLSYRLSTLEQKVEEVNSASKAQLDLMQKILETNRKILTELEAKK